MPTSYYWVQSNNNSNDNTQPLQLSHVDPQTRARAKKLNTALLSFSLCVNLLKTKQRQKASEELLCFSQSGQGCHVAVQGMGWDALSSCRDIALKDRFSSSSARLWSRKVQSNEQVSEMIFSWYNFEIVILIRKGLIMVPNIQFIFSVLASYLIWAETHSNHISY